MLCGSFVALLVVPGTALAAEAESDWPAWIGSVHLEVASEYRKATEKPVAVNEVRPEPVAVLPEKPVLGKEKVMTSIMESEFVEFVNIPERFRPLHYSHVRSADEETYSFFPEKIVVTGGKGEVAEWPTWIGRLN